MTRVLWAFLAPAALLAGCAPRQAHYRPAGRRAVGRGGFVGACYRVPPGADRDAQAVAALSPLVRPEGEGQKAEVRALIEFRNKSKAAVIFLPGSVRLVTDGLAAFRPAEVKRGNRAVKGIESVPHWHRAGFLARWVLPADQALAQKAWTLHWAYRYRGRNYANETRFTATGPELARRSFSGGAPGLAARSGYSYSAGVPFLMDVPFLGGLFRTSGGARAGYTTGLDLGRGARSVPGAWWPLEPEVSR